ncbi:MAG TPA: PEGA domain-containing protein [Polyangiales bacterium]|nr:PEGA domain-containing protein [Polyangiales bacterium]
MAKLLALFLLCGCAGAQLPRSRPAELRTIVEPPTAAVQIDERFAGAARVLAMRPASVKPGKHRITVEAPGYFPHDAELELVPGVTTVNLKLRPVPP